MLLKWNRPVSHTSFLSPPLLSLQTVCEPSPGACAASSRSPPALLATPPWNSTVLLCSPLARSRCPTTTAAHGSGRSLLRLRMQTSRAARLPFATSHRSLACVARPRPALACMARCSPPTPSARACTTSTTLATRGFGRAVRSKHERRCSSGMRSSCYVFQDRLI